MTKYEISNQHSGIVLGVYEGDTEEAALDAMARDAGYHDHAHLDREVPAVPGEILIIAVEDPAPTFQPPSFEAKFQGTTLGYFATADEAQAAIDAAQSEVDADAEAQ